MKGSTPNVMTISFQKYRGSFPNIVFLYNHWFSYHNINDESIIWHLYTRFSNIFPIIMKWTLCLDATVTALACMAFKMRDSEEITKAKTISILVADIFHARWTHLCLVNDHGSQNKRELEHLINIQLSFLLFMLCRSRRQSWQLKVRGYIYMNHLFPRP